MAFSPIAGAEQIEAKYLRYLMTLFSINDPVYQEQFEEQIHNRKTFSNGPYLEAHDNYLPGKTIRQLVQEKVLPEFFLKFGFYLDRPLYKHQEMAILKALAGDNLVVSTGTGSGKTESFLIPIFAELADEAEKGELEPGVRALLIYPMNALANDQIERLRELLVNTPEITFGSYTGQTKQTTADALAEYRRLNDQKDPLKNELISRDQMKATPPHILVTNYAMLEYLMVRPGDNVFFNNWSWKTVVMDEAHIYRGSTGIEVSMLIRRLNAVLEGCHLQYFLTSATLGDESENREVAEFATNLCDSPFTEKNIIRAVRAKVPMPVNMLNVPMDIYTEVEKQIEHEQTSDQIGQQLLERFPEWNLDRQKPLFDMVHRDRLFWQLRTALKESRTARELSRELDIGTGELETVINVASFCEAGGIRLLDARYHMFLRATDSVFITLPPSSKLVLTRTKSIYDPKERESFKAFEISTCSSCHSIYLMGELGDNGCIEQTSLPEKQTAFYLGNQVSSTDEDSKDEEGNIIPGQVCAVCGYFMKEKVKGHRPCEHGMKYMVPVIQVKSKSDDHRIKKCVCCESVNNRGILRPFFTGQEAVTSVLATSLFEALPATVQIEHPVTAEGEDEFGFATEETSVTETKNVARQFLCFSDSRQASAYFATYLDTTYRKILYKRCIVEQLGKRKDQRLSEFCEDLQAIFDTHNVFAGTDARSEKENWKAILAEASDQSGDSSLSSLGIMKIGLKENLFQKNDKLNLSQDEVNALFNVLLDGLITDLAIQIPVGMTEEDREFYSFGAAHGKYVMTAGNKQKYVKNFIPSLEMYSNKRQDYLLRVMEKKLPSLAEVSKVRRLMENLWKQLLAKDILVPVEGNAYQIRSEALYVHQPAKWYRCRKCHKLTPYNIAGVCMTYHCGGELEPADPETENQENHYYRLYHDLDIWPLRVREHTAQLDRNKAYEYQQAFKKKKLDVLSCSTTFEMGVDVGSLETVFMRNMPPMPSNYAQRAGRAGRSRNSAAFALTFCNRSNHDFAYFNRPLDMISGKIHAPHFNIQNEKIAIRHIYASALAFFWRRHPELFSTVKTMLEDNPETVQLQTGDQLFEEYLSKKPGDLRAYLKRAFPDSICRIFDVDHYGWVEGLIGHESGNEGVLSRAISEYEYEVDLLEKAREEAYANHRSTSYYENRLKNYWREDILSFMSRHNVLPQYGFPVDTVTMSVFSGKGEQPYGVELNRDMAIAISEYAPDSQVVANGNMFTGRYIRRVRGIGWKAYDYDYCPACETINIDPHMGDGQKNPRLQKCKMCDTPLNQNTEGTFIIPSFGFEADPNDVKKPTLIRPERTYRTEVSYVGYRADIAMTEGTVGRSRVQTFFSAKDEMAVLNKSSFHICEVCGYAVRAGFTRIHNEEHLTSAGRKCPSTILKKYSLGYRFETDVFLLVFPDEMDYLHQNTAWSVLYALLRGVTDTLDLEESDIAGCLQRIRKDGYGSTCFILYDTTPGGAGHVRRLLDASLLQRSIQRALELVRACTCGGLEGHASCYACLRSYRNQKIHDILDRSLAIQFLSKLY